MGHIWQYIIILVIAIIIAVAIVKSKQKDFKLEAPSLTLYD